MVARFAVGGHVVGGWCGDVSCRIGSGPRAVMAIVAAPVKLRDALASAICATGLATKVLARRIAADPRAVEEWRQGHTLPRAEHLIALARECPEVRAELMRRMGA